MASVQNTRSILLKHLVGYVFAFVRFEYALDALQGGRFTDAPSADQGDAVGAEFAAHFIDLALAPKKHMLWHRAPCEKRRNRRQVHLVQHHIAQGAGGQARTDEVFYVRFI